MASDDSLAMKMSVAIFRIHTLRERQFWCFWLDGFDVFFIENGQNCQ